MKTSTNKIISGLLLAVAAFAGCEFNATNSQSDVADTKNDTLTYEYTDYIQFSDHLVKTEETTDTTFFSVSYPVFTDSAVNRFVNSALLGSDTATAEKSATEFISEFDRFIASDPFPRVWVSESNARVSGITPSYLEIAINAYTYTGGAHGNYATVFEHYDLPTQQILALDRIVDTTYQNELTAVAERYFRQQENLSVDQSLEDRYFFDGGQFSLPQNFSLEQDSILFLYNIYEIKPYVNGQTELRVPYSDINRLLSNRAKQIIHELQQ